MIPSANFMVLHEEAKEKNREMQEFSEKEKTSKLSDQNLSEDQEENRNSIKSVILEEERDR